MKKVDSKKIFGTSVKFWRKLLGVSQETLAERSALHRTYISDVERGARNPSLKSILRLAEALEVSVAALFPAELQSGQTSQPGGPEQARKGVDILLVEDSPDDVEMTLHAFEKARFANRIQVVRDGAEALDYLFCQKQYARRSPVDAPQVVLLDLNLPKVSGMEVLHRIKTDVRTATIRVVMLTGADDDASYLECLRHGADNYIVKPVDFQRLSEATPKLNLNWVLQNPS
jgi:CheY-like chemotaxis protein/DNA-binding XRE family transcriptional regulator